jgi:ribonuclease HI
MPIDPEVAARLALALHAISHGESPGGALRQAGVTAAEAESLFQELAPALRALRSEVPGKKKQTEKKKRPAAVGSLENAVAYSDGGSRGNPGEAACAVILFDNSGSELLRRAKRLGKATNNQAEYEGVIYALELAGQLGTKKLEIKSDSELVVRQLEGTYKVKNLGLKPYYARANSLVDDFRSVSVTHIPRKENKLADKLVNACLDGKDLPED